MISQLLPSPSRSQSKLLADRAYIRSEMAQATPQATPPETDYTVRGSKQYELCNHLGNVLATVYDRRLQAATPVAGTSGVTAELLSASDYYAFGMEMPGRQFLISPSYRYGFNGKESDNEVKGFGNQQDYGMRTYDPRVARFLSVDPLEKQYPELTPYQFASNSPVENIDRDGLEKKNSTDGSAPRKTHLKLITHEDTYQSSTYIRLREDGMTYPEGKYGYIFKRGEKPHRTPTQAQHWKTEMRRSIVEEGEGAVYIKRTTKVFGIPIKSHVSVYVHGFDQQGKDKTQDMMQKRNRDNIRSNDIKPGTEFKEQYRRQLRKKEYDWKPLKRK